MYPYQEYYISDAYFPICRDLPQRLTKALTGERDAQLYYEQLATMAPSPEDKNIITQILNDEKKHYNNFNRLFVQITGQQPVLPPPTQPDIPDYLDGIAKAIMDETDAYEFYRNTYMCTNNPFAKEIFFEAMTDEIEHAVKHNYLYSKNK